MLEVRLLPPVILSCWDSRVAVATQCSDLLDTKVSRTQSQHLKGCSGLLLFFLPLLLLFFLLLVSNAVMLAPIRSFKETSALMTDFS